MNTEENLINSANKIFEKIFDEMLEGIDKKKELESIKKKSVEEQNNNYRNYNISIYNDLVQKFQLIKNTNSPINETIKALTRFIRHLLEQLDTRSTSNMMEDVEFCNQIFGLKNIVTDYKLGLERQFLASSEIQEPIERKTSRKNAILEYNETEFSKNQLLFLFNQMRKERIITSNISNVDIATAVEILTGKSHKQFGPDLGGVERIEYSKQEKEQLKSKLDKLSKAVDSLRDKK